MLSLRLLRQKRRQRRCAWHWPLLLPADAFGISVFSKVFCQRADYWRSQGLTWEDNKT